MTDEKYAFLFPGQGSQTLGMGQQLAQLYLEAADTFQEADSILGMPLSELCWNGPEAALNDTINTQPALLAHSTAVFRVVQSQFPHLKMSYSAGHSVGQYAALVAAGALTFRDALICVRERGRVMKLAGEETPGGMTAVLGLELENVDRVCEEISSRTGHCIWVANDNCPGQVVISGTNACLVDAEKALSSAGALKVVRLAVSIASHCPLMLKAQERLNRILNEIAIKDPNIPIIGNVSPAFLHTAEEIKEDLKSQLISRVHWYPSMRLLIARGVTRCYELGPGSVLSGLMRRIDRSVPTIPLDSPSTLSSLRDPIAING